MAFFTCGSQRRRESNTPTCLSNGKRSEVPTVNGASLPGYFLRCSHLTVCHIKTAPQANTMRMTFLTAIAPQYRASNARTGAWARRVGARRLPSPSAEVDDDLRPEGIWTTLLSTENAGSCRAPSSPAEPRPAVELVIVLPLRFNAMPRSHGHGSRTVLTWPEPSRPSFQFHSPQTFQPVNPASQFWTPGSAFTRTLTGRAMDVIHANK